jgi:hypothetical protein
MAPASVADPSIASRDGIFGARRHRRHLGDIQCPIRIRLGPQEKPASVAVALDRRPAVPPSAGQFGTAGLSKPRQRGRIQSVVLPAWPPGGVRLHKSSEDCPERHRLPTRASTPDWRRPGYQCSCPGPRQGYGRERRHRRERPVQRDTCWPVCAAAEPTSPIRRSQAALSRRYADIPP